jgi:hypothetical protein
MDESLAPVDTPSTDAASAAPPSPAPTESTPSTPVTAGDTAVATDAASVYRELQAAKSDGTPPDAPPDPSLAQAATQPDGTSEAPGSLPNNGAIPLDRHKAVVTNTRRKALAEYGIEETTQPKDVSTAVSLYGWLQKDPRGFVRMVQSQLGEDATASAAAPAAKPAEDPEPEPDVPLQDGRFVYSAEQLRARDQWRERKLMAQFDEKYGPIRDEHELNKLTATRKAEATQLVSQAAEQWPRFAQLKPHIKQIIAAHSGPMTPTVLYDAYIAADRQHGEKILRAQWDAERSGQLTRKASASTVHPGAPRPSTPRPDSELTTRDIIRQEARRLAAG